MPRVEFDQRDGMKGRKGIPGPIFAGIVVVGICTAVYFAIVKPLYLEPDKYREMQKINRKGIDQSKIQPGDMKVWSNPYEKK